MTRFSKCHSVHIWPKAQFMFVIEDSRNCIKFHVHCWYWWDRGSFSMIICCVPIPQYKMPTITYVEKVGNWSVIFIMLSYSNFLRWMIIILIFLPIQPQSVFSTCIITGGCCLKGRSQIFKNISNVYRHFYNQLYGSFRQILNGTGTGNIGLLYISIVFTLQRTGTGIKCLPSHLRTFLGPCHTIKYKTRCMFVMHEFIPKRIHQLAYRPVVY